MGKKTEKLIFTAMTRSAATEVTATTLFLIIEGGTIGASLRACWRSRTKPKKIVAAKRQMISFESQGTIRPPQLKANKKQRLAATIRAEPIASTRPRFCGSGTWRRLYRQKIMARITKGS